MPTRGKKYRDSIKLVDRQKRYDNIQEAMALVKSMTTTKFDASVDVAVRLGVDPRHADQMVRGAVVLPHGLGKTVRVVVFASGEKEKEAREAGADFVGADDLVQKISDGWFEFDKVIATPDMMGKVGRLGRVLGPRGLMPNPKSGTVTMDITRAIHDIKAGKVEYRVDKQAICHVPFGKASFGVEKLTENFNTLMEALVKAKPAAAKGVYFRSIYIATTMGPSIKVLYRMG